MPSDKRQALTDRMFSTVHAVEDERLRAVATNDTATLERLLPEDLHYVHASGIVETKRAFIDMLASGRRRYKRFEPVNRTTRQEGDLILLFGQCDVEVERQAGNFETRINYTAVYHIKPTPRLIAWHSCRAVHET